MKKAFIIILNLGNNSILAKSKALNGFNSIYCNVNNFGANTVRMDCILSQHAIRKAK